jgi:hypothetical protein
MVVCLHPTSFLFTLPSPVHRRISHCITCWQYYSSSGDGAIVVIVCCCCCSPPPSFSGGTVATALVSSVAVAFVVVIVVSVRGGSSVGVVYLSLMSSSSYCLVLQTGLEVVLATLGRNLFSLGCGISGVCCSRCHVISWM